MDRRSFLRGIVAMPAVVATGSIMPVKLWRPEISRLPFHPSTIAREALAILERDLRARNIAHAWATAKDYAEGGSITASVGGPNQAWLVDFRLTDEIRSLPMAEIRSRYLEPGIGALIYNAERGL